MAICFNENVETVAFIYVFFPIFQNCAKVLYRK
jgi:hypothetical protein